MGKLTFPYMLVHGDQQAMEFIRGNRASSLSDALAYKEGDLVFIDGSDSGNVKRATAVAASLPKLAISGQDYEVDEQFLPPNDGSTPHWFYERGVPLNKIPVEHEFVFTLRGGSGGAAANGTKYAITSADLTTIQAGTEVELFNDTTDNVLVVNAAGTSNPNVQLIRTLKRDVEAGEEDVAVVVRILPDFLLK